jgi:hypothetical protein
VVGGDLEHRFFSMDKSIKDMYDDELRDSNLSCRYLFVVLGNTDGKQLACTGIQVCITEYGG